MLWSNILTKSNAGGKGLFALRSQATVYHFGEVKAGTQAVHHIHSKSKEYKPVLPCCFRSVSSFHSYSSGPSPWNSTTHIQGGAPNTVSNQDNPPTDMYIGQYNPDNPQVKCWRRVLFVSSWKSKPTTTPLVPGECSYPCSAHQLLSICPSHYTASPWRQNYGFLAIYA